MGAKTPIIQITSRKPPLEIYVSINYILFSVWFSFFFSAAGGAINDNIIVFTFKLLVSIKFQASLIAQLVKNPPAMQETPVQFLGWEDLLEKG